MSTSPSQSDLAGLIVPLLTPFAADGAVDSRALGEHVCWLAEAGVRRILVGGTTGEFFSMTDGERLDALETVRKAFAGTVLMQVGGGPLRQATALAEEAAARGADGVLALPPAYFANVPAGGLIEWFTSLAEASDLPLVIYNFPRHTGNDITVKILQAVPHVGLKDSSATFALIPATPRYFVGGDARILDAARAGAAGFVSAASNVNPAAFVALESALDGGDEASAKRAHRRVMSIPRERGAAEIPAAKRLLAKVLPGYPSAVRLPLQQGISDGR
jgi:4-hydroxy-tetrahydrodipicolinate synthase